MCAKWILRGDFAMAERLDLYAPVSPRYRCLLYDGVERQRYNKQGRALWTKENGKLETRFIYKVDHTKMEMIEVLPTKQF